MEANDQIRIRSFSPDDYDSVIQLWRSSGLTIKASDSLPELEKVLAFNPDRFLVAELSTDAGPKLIVGSVIGAFDGRRAWIYHLAVVADARRHSMGTRLLREVETRLRAAGATKINLLVEAENTVASCFYQSLGYTEVRFIFFTKEL